MTDRQLHLSPLKNSERSARFAVSWLTGLFVLALWVFFAFWVYDYQTRSRSAIENMLDRHRAAVSEHVNGVFKINETFLAGANRWIADHPQRDPRRDAQFAEYVEAFQRVTNMSMLVRLIEGDGSMHLVPAVKSAQQINVADRDYFAAVMAAAPGAIFISAPFQGRATGKWMLVVATRLAQPSHGVVAMMVAVELSVFDRAFESARLYDAGSISLVRRDGILLARSASKPGELGRNLSKSVVFTEGVSRSASGVMFTDGALTDGVPKLIAYGLLPNYPLVVTVGYAMSVLQRDMDRVIHRVAIILLLVSAMALLARCKIVVLLDRLVLARERLSLLATTDDLTGIHNRRRFIELFDEAIKRSRRYNTPLALIVIDLDFFKQVNDTYGHQAGDLTLRVFAEAVRACLREVDEFGRVGGEEFCVLMPSTEIEGAMQAAERIRQRVAETTVPWGDMPYQITASLGVTTLGAADQNFDDVYARADKALYLSKNRGRDCVSQA